MNAYIAKCSLSTYVQELGEDKLRSETSRRLEPVLVTWKRRKTAASHSAKTGARLHRSKAAAVIGLGPYVLTMWDT